MVYQILKSEKRRLRGGSRKEFSYNVDGEQVDSDDESMDEKQGSHKQVEEPKTNIYVLRRMFEDLMRTSQQSEKPHYWHQSRGQEYKTVTFQLDAELLLKDDKVQWPVPRKLEGTC